MWKGLQLKLLIEVKTPIKQHDFVAWGGKLAKQSRNSNDFINSESC